MHKFILIIFFIIISQISFGQTNLRGKINDTNIVFSTLRVLSLPDSNIIFISSVDTTGIIDITIKNLDSSKLYLISITHLESEDTFIPFKITNSTQIIDLGTILLKRKKVKRLDEVTISSKKYLIERKIDRLVFNVENSISSQGRNLLELLSKTPLVVVQNRNVSVIGKGNVSILINDRFIYLSGDELANYLEAIPSEDILKIEVITNPSSKYDANGGALINIVTKKIKLLGTNGNITSSLTKAYNENERIGMMINHRRKKMNIYGSFNLRNGKNTFTEKTNYLYSSYTNIGLDTIETFTKATRYSLGFDYYGKNQTLSGSNELMFFNKDMNTNSKYNYQTIFNKSDSLLATISKANNITLYNSSNLNYVVNLDSTGKKININANYLTNINKIDNDFFTSIKSNSNQNNSSSVSSSSDQKINIGTFNSDLVLPLKNIYLEFGGKFNWINNQGSNLLRREINKIVLNDSIQNGSFIYNEITQAIYTNAYKALGKIEIQLGLRMENTNLNGRTPTSSYQVTRNFFNVFPTAYLLYNINDKHNISLSYGKRIDRPNYYSLNPFKSYLTPYIYKEGNPLLRPTYISELELNYTLSNSYIFGLLYTNFNNSYNEVPIKINDNNFAYLQSNIGNTNQYGISFNIPLNFKEKIQSHFTLIYLYSVFLPNTINFKKSSTNIFFGNINTSYYLDKNKKLSGDISLQMRPFGSIYTSSIMNSQYILGFGFKIKILKNLGSISLTANDLFMQSTPKSKTISNNFRIESTNYYDTRSIVLAFNYRFGNNFLKNRMNRDSGNENEKNRIK